MGVFAWQRVVLEVPDKWAPLRVEGDSAKGAARLADLHRPRLALRWQRLRRAPKDPAALVRDSLRGEVGSAGAAEATPPEVLPVGAAAALVYEDVDPVTRDVAAAYFPAARCLVQIVYPVRRREWTLRQTLLPSLTVVPDDRPAPWSVFGLGCLTPPGLELTGFALNAGDLSLTFRRGKTRLTVRELAAPDLALSRSSLHGWLRSMQARDERFFKPAGDAAPFSPAWTPEARDGLRLPMRLKRRFAPLARLLPAPPLTLGYRDARRDRLVLLHGNDEPLLGEVGSTLGVAAQPSPVA